MFDVFRCLTATALIGLGAPAFAAEGQLPLLRTPVLEPTLMGPATVGDTFANGQGGADRFPWQTGGFFRAEAAICKPNEPGLQDRVEIASQAVSPFRETVREMLLTRCWTLAIRCRLTREKSLPLSHQKRRRPLVCSTVPFS